MDAMFCFPATNSFVSLPGFFGTHAALAGQMKTSLPTGTKDPIRPKQASVTPEKGAQGSGFGRCTRSAEKAQERRFRRLGDWPEGRRKTAGSAKQLTLWLDHICPSQTGTRDSGLRIGRDELE